jgi:hypothetical protein
MMQCAEAREAFSARIDDALTPEELARLERHVATCAACDREWHDFSRAVALARTTAAVRAPDGFVDRVLARTRREPWLRRLLRAVFVPLPSKLPVEAAAVVLISVIGILVYRQSPELRRAAETSATVSPATPSAVHPDGASPTASPAPLSQTAAPPAAPQADVSQEVAPAAAMKKEREAQTTTAPEAPRPRAQVMKRAGEATARRDVAAKAADRGEATRDRLAPTDTAAPAPPAAAARPAPGAAAPSDVQAFRPQSGVVAVPRVPEAPPENRPAASSAPAADGVRMARVAPAQIRAELRVSDPAGADAGLREAAAHAGGRLAGCTDAPYAARDCLLFVPLDGYSRLSVALGGLGRFTETSRPAGLTDPVAVVVRVRR